MTVASPHPIPTTTLQGIRSVVIIQTHRPKSSVDDEFAVEMESEPKRKFTAEARRAPASPQRRDAQPAIKEPVKPPRVKTDTIRPNRAG